MLLSGTSEGMYHITRVKTNDQMKVTGVVTVRLYKGSATVVNLDSPYSLFDANLATFNTNGA